MRSRGSKSKLFVWFALSSLTLLYINQSCFQFPRPSANIPFSRKKYYLCICIYMRRWWIWTLGCQVLLTFWIRLFYRLHVEVLNSEPRLSCFIWQSEFSSPFICFAFVFFCFYFRCFHFDFQTLLWDYPEQEKIKGVWRSMSRLKLSKPSVGEGTQTKETENPSEESREFGGPFISVFATSKRGRLMVPCIVYLFYTNRWCNLQVAT